MSVTIRNLFQGSLTTSAVALVTAAVNTRVRITQCNAVNYSAGAATVILHRVASGGSASDSTRLISDKSLAADASYQCPEAIGVVLEAGETLQGLSDTGAAVAVAISGQVVT
jgi:hypothetical protein